MKLRNELMALNHNNPVEAGARLAYELMQDDPNILKAGYTRDNAVLSALEMFPEITPAKRWRLHIALDHLLVAS